jgi:hypothetical protein
MKVIEKGPGRKLWSKEVICTGAANEGCGSKLLVEEADLYTVSRGNESPVVCLSCCVCGTELLLEDQLPAYVLDKVLTKRSWKKRQSRLISGN